MITLEQIFLSIFFPVCSFIENAESKNSMVLIHCGEGVSRSCTLTISYLMIKKGMSLKDSLLLVKKKRPQCNPNNGFMRQLIQLEKKLNSCDLSSVEENLFEDDWGFGCYEIYKLDALKSRNT